MEVTRAPSMTIVLSINKVIHTRNRIDLLETMQDLDRYRNEDNNQRKVLTTSDPQMSD